MLASKMRREPHWGGAWVAQRGRFAGSIHIDANPVRAAIANPTIEEEIQTGESLDLPWQVVVHNDPAFVGIRTDVLFPAAEVRQLAQTVAAAGVRVQYLEMDSDHGHDAFLAEGDKLFKLLS